MGRRLRDGVGVVVPQVFISHSQVDREEVMRLAAALEARAIQCFTYDNGHPVREGIIAAQSAIDLMQEGLPPLVDFSYLSREMEASIVVLFFHTPAFEVSSSCEGEVSFSRGLSAFSLFPPWLACIKDGHLRPGLPKIRTLREAPSRDRDYLSPEQLRARIERYVTPSPQYDYTDVADQVSRLVRFRWLRANPTSPYNLERSAFPPAVDLSRERWVFSQAGTPGMPYFVSDRYARFQARSSPGRRASGPSHVGRAYAHEATREAMSQPSPRLRRPRWPAAVGCTASQ